MSDVFLSVLIYLSLGLLIIMVELTRRRTIPYDAMFLFNLSYFVYFVLAPLHVLLGGSGFTRYQFVYTAYGPGDSLDAAWVALSYILVLTGFFLTPQTAAHFAVYRLKSSIATVTCIFLFLVASVCLVIYAQTVGGILTAVRQAIYIRMGVYSIEGGWLFVKHLIPLFSAVLILVFALLLRQTGTVVPNRAAGMLLAFLVLCTIFAAVLVGGRRAMLFPFLTMFFIYSNYRGRWHVRAGTTAALVLVLFLMFWDAVSFGIRDADFATHIIGRYSSMIRAYESVWTALADPYMGWVGLHNRDSAWLGFTDLLGAPLQILPGSFFAGLAPESLVTITTETLKGISVELTAETPPGFHGYFYFNGSYLGLIVGSLLFGVLGKVLHSLFLPRANDPVSITVYVWIIIGWAYFVRHGVLEFVITERFHWWFSLGALVLISASLQLRTIVSTGGYASTSNGRN